MTEEVAPRPFRWSFSQWETYNECPQKWKFKSVMRLPSSPPGPAAARGLSMHDRAESYIKKEIDWETAKYSVNPQERFGDKKPVIIHDDYRVILDQFRDHDNGARHTEYKMAFDSEWHLCGWQSSLPQVIGILDAVRAKDGICHIGEWKSGKPKDTHADQRKLYAMFGLKGWLSDEVRVTTYYLEGTAPPARLVVKDTAMPKLIQIWDERAGMMQRDKILAPKPGVHCNWCDYAKKRGGPCQFGG